MRYLILSFTLALSLLMGVLTIVKPARAATTFTVTTTSDAVIDGDGCSLREAIIASNTDSAFSDCPAGSGADTILFGAGLPQPAIIVLTNAGAGEDGALTGDLDIAGNLTISATDSIVVDGDGLDRIFEILPGARANISGLTIRNGNPGSGVDGGGLAVGLSGVLTLTNSSVLSNTAAQGGGISVLGRLSLKNTAVDANQGGGIRNDGGLVTLHNARIRDNTGTGVRNENLGTLTVNGGLVRGNQGGGIYINSSFATLSNATIISNTGSGGVFNAGAGTKPARVTVGACTIMSNTATSGAGIYNSGIGAIAIINNTDISANTATTAGGGVFNNGIMTLNGSTIRHNRARSGGGIDHFGGNLTMTNDTVSSNTADDNGGGLYNRSDALLWNITFSSNDSDGFETGGNIFNNEAALSLGNTIVALSDADGNCFNSEGFLNSLGHNLDSGNTCEFNATGDITATNPLLGPLQDNGGNTPTQALLPGSPAIDKGDDASCPATDQRGLPRPHGLACDIGAYEYGGTADLSISKARQGSGSVTAGGPITFTITITNAGPTTPVTVTVVDSWTPIHAVVGVDAPGCAVDLAGGLITCTHTNLGTQSAVVPSPYVVLTTNTAFSGTLTNVANVAPTGGVADTDPANNVSDPVFVSITSSYRYSLYLPIVAR